MKLDEADERTQIRTPRLSLLDPRWMVVKILPIPSWGI
jgi:hypothetical protein